MVDNTFTDIAGLYPAKYESEAVLKDGSSLSLRPIKTEDAGGLLAFIQRLTPATRERVFRYLPRDMDMEFAVRFCAVDYENTFALVAEVLREPNRDIVALGRYYRLPNSRSAEIYLFIEDAYQNKGIGTILLERLAEIAREKGITRFEADVLAENDRMIMLFQHYGFHIESELKAGGFHITFPIARTRTVERKEEKRERTATLASLRYLLSPRSVALIGASRHEGTIGHLLLQCLLKARYSGAIYPVNPGVDSLMSLKCYPSVGDIPGDIDMAIIAVPAKLVPGVADECGHKGVHTLVVISDGFGETGPEGAAREKELRDFALGHGMRIVGPNCMGVINTDPAIRMNATFSTVFPPRGNVAFLSQSGALGLSILEYARNLNLGVSTFVSAGNRVDISSNDLLEYWEVDRKTKVILLYLESFGNAPRFARIARRVAARKPVLVVKGGSTQAGSRAASSHTGAMATSDVASDVLFRHAGMVRLNTMEEMFDIATLLSNQPLPRGRRLTILTNGGGPGIIAADASARHGLTLPQFSPETVGKLQAAIKRDIRINNPLDTTAGATAEDFDNVLRVLSEDDGTDAVLMIYIPPVVSDTKLLENTVKKYAPVFWKAGKPLMACFLGRRGIKARLGSRGKYVPFYPFPEEAVAALSLAADYAEMRSRPRGKIVRFRGIKREQAESLIKMKLAATTQRPLWLNTNEIAALLDCYGIRMAKTLSAATPAEAAAMARRVGFPVVLKLASSTITHKSDVGGVVLDLRSSGQVEQAFTEIKDNLAKLNRAGEMKALWSSTWLPEAWKPLPA